MELYGVLETLKYFDTPTQITIYSDSQYVVNEFTEWFRNQMMKNFFDTKNKEVIIYARVYIF